MADQTVRVSPDSPMGVIQVVKTYRQEAERARRPRQMKNRKNFRAYNNEQDWSHKIAGQSKEFLPKTATSTEQFAAFVERGLTQFGAWFSVEAPEAPFGPATIIKIMDCFLDQIPDKRNTTIPLSTRISDGVKLACLEAEMVLKVHGGLVKRPQLAERGETVLELGSSGYRLFYDLVRNEDYFKDPTGAGLYRIHRTERDLNHVMALAEQGVYDKAVVERVAGAFERETEDRWRMKDINRQETPAFRRRAVIDECYGTLLDQNGNAVQEDVFCSVLNDQWLIREPTPYPWWHGGDPFVEIPLIRVPFEEYDNKALADDGVNLNLALNELFNLILDGGIASVWGIMQLHTHYVSRSEDLAGGIPQGKTIEVTEDTPPGLKVLEQVTEGQVPQDALATFNLIDREYNVSQKTNDLKLGLLPPKQVKATEVVEASQSSAVGIDAIVKPMEAGLERALSKGWALLMQNIDSIAMEDLKPAMDNRELVTLLRMPVEQRFKQMVAGCMFRVRGLSATLAKARDFQRLMAVLQVTSQSPILMPAFMRRISPDKVITNMWRLMNLNPRDYERSEDEIENAQNDIQALPGLLGALGPGGNAGSGVTGEPGLPSEINQSAAPSSGV